MTVRYAKRGRTRAVPLDEDALEAIVAWVKSRPSAPTERQTSAAWCAAAFEQGAGDGWEPEELVAGWTLREEDRRLVANKTGATRLRPRTPASAASPPAATARARPRCATSDGCSSRARTCIGPSSA